MDYQLMAQNLSSVMSGTANVMGTVAVLLIAGSCFYKSITKARGAAILGMCSAAVACMCLCIDVYLI